MKCFWIFFHKWGQWEFTENSIYLGPFLGRTCAVCKKTELKELEIKAPKKRKQQESSK